MKSTITESPRGCDPMQGTCPVCSKPQQKPLPHYAPEFWGKPQSLSEIALSPSNCLLGFTSLVKFWDYENHKE